MRDQLLGFAFLHNDIFLLARVKENDIVAVNLREKYELDHGSSELGISHHRSFKLPPPLPEYADYERDRISILFTSQPSASFPSSRPVPFRAIRGNRVIVINIGYSGYDSNGPRGRFIRLFAHTDDLLRYITHSPFHIKSSKGRSSKGEYSDQNRQVDWKVWGPQCCWAGPSADDDLSPREWRHHNRNLEGTKYGWSYFQGYHQQRFELFLVEMNKMKYRRMAKTAVNEQAHEAAQRDADLIPECGPYVLPLRGGISCPGKSVLLETLMIKEVAVSEDGIVIVQISVSSNH